MPRTSNFRGEKPRIVGKTYAHITPAYLHERFSYDPDTGTFTRKACNGSPAEVITRVNKGGYLVVSVGATCLVHRLIWLMQTGKWPEHTIDHEDGDKTNNRWANLKDRTHSQNMLGSRPALKNQSGARGVRKLGDRWRGSVCWQGKDHYTPTRDTIQEVEADLAILRAKLRDSRGQV